MYTFDRTLHPIAEAVIRVYDPDSEPCSGGHIKAYGMGVTDDDGRSDLHMYSCDRVKLVVSSPRYYPAEKLFDTCKEGSVRFELVPRPAETADAQDEAVTTTRAFLEALRWGRFDVLRELLLQPNDVERYGGRGLQSDERDCDLRFIRMQGDVMRSVEFALECDSSCSTAYVVQLTRRNDRWRVLSLARPTK